jgi:hypothetical protein
MPPNTVKVTRPGRWGNPFNLRSSDHCWTAIAHGFKADRAGRQAASVAVFRAWVLGGAAAEVGDCGLYIETNGESRPISVSPTIAAPTPPSLEEIRRELGGKNLACWCQLDQPCHADVLLDLANPTCEPVAQQPERGRR